MKFPEALAVPIQKVEIPFPNNIHIYIKREDLVHPLLSGNKFWKLKYNFEEALSTQKETLITFGGAFSNHLYALAALGKITGIKTIGIVRGQELAVQPKNKTLQFCEENGMKLFFVSREAYRMKEESLEIQSILRHFPNHFLIPEGGTNELAIQGTQEILNSETETFSHICCAIGTGGTIAGLSLAAQSHQEILGFSSLKKGSFLTEEIKKYSKKDNFNVILPYHFGGYGKFNEQLLQFIEKFKQNADIPLDKIYTGKMMFGILDLIEKGKFPPHSKILAIHTGGLQGN